MALKGIRYHSDKPPHYGCWVWDLKNPNHKAMLVGSWRIESDRLYHRHQPQGLVHATEYDVNDRECWKCRAICPDEIWFAHRLQQL